MCLELTKEPVLGTIDYFNSNQQKYQQKCNRTSSIAYNQLQDTVGENFDDIPSQPHDLAYY